LDAALTLAATAAAAVAAVFVSAGDPKGLEGADCNNKISQKQQQQQQKHLVCLSNCNEAQRGIDRHTGASFQRQLSNSDKNRHQCTSGCWDHSCTHAALLCIGLAGLPADVLCNSLR
jgi:hypothetical protein